MGLARKTMFVATGGAVRPTSRKERAAKRQARKQGTAAVQPQAPGSLPPVGSGTAPAPSSKMPGALIFGGVILLLAIIGLANGGDREPAPVSSAPVASGSSGSSGQSWTMPYLVGSTLQDAQDAIQSLTGYAISYTSSHDSAGKGRNQVLDRGWKVCDQNVAPGTRITVGTRIDFGAVKLGERC